MADLNRSLFVITTAVSAGDTGLSMTRILQFGEWEFAWRAAIASWVGIGVATSGYLFIVEVLGAAPGYAGGFALVIWYLISFTVVGGPALAGLLAAVRRPRLRAQCW